MRILSTAILSVALSGLAAAESQTLAVTGTNPDGSAYSGTITISDPATGGKVEGRVYEVVWDIGGTQVAGVGIVGTSDPNVMAISYPYGDGTGVVLMQRNDTGATGTWYLPGQSGSGTETWTKAASTGAATPAPPGAAGGLTYDHAVECAAATSFVLGMLRSTPGADQAKMAAYDKANSAWIMKISDFPEGKDMGKNIDAIQAKQNAWAADADGLTKATPIADDCMATAPPME